MSDAKASCFQLIHPPPKIGTLKILLLVMQMLAGQMLL